MKRKDGVCRRLLGESHFTLENLTIWFYKLWEVFATVYSKVRRIKGVYGAKLWMYAQGFENTIRRVTGAYYSARE